MMKDLAKLNREKIEKFNFDSYLKNKNYQMASAIGALLTTNDIQMAYLKDENDLTKADYSLRLYALLQALFVSIDSLYVIAYSLTKSKNFININSNADLRILKYIRNDVVGHPSNRIISSDVAYCLLDDNSITKESFDYYVYYENEVEKRTINVMDTLNSYYVESNSLLDNLYQIENSKNDNTIYKKLIDKAIDEYMNGYDYIKTLDELIKEYKKEFTNLKISNSRILWRYDIINKLRSFKTKNNDERDVIDHCIGIEVFKIYELINKTKYSISMNKRNPKYISSLYRFLNKNKDLVDLLDYLKKCDQPTFYPSLCKVYNAAVRVNNTNVASYLKMIKEAYSYRRDEVVYGLCLPFKQYIRK